MTEPLAAPKPDPIILFDSWTSQMEVQDTHPPRLTTLFGLMAGNGWTWAQTTNPITREQLLNADGTPRPGVLVIPTRFNEYQNPHIDPTFSSAELDAIVDYVQAGGSLLHMTNHSIFSQYDAALAARFGIGLDDVFLNVPGMTISGSGLNRENPVLAGSSIVQSICAHDGCRMTVAPDNLNNPVPLATFVPEGEEESQLFAVSMTPGAGRAVYTVNSGWIGDYGTGTPAWGLLPYGNNIAFIQTVLGWLLRCDPSMEPVSYEPPKPHPVHWVHDRGAWPSFSPDGSRIVFTQAGEDGGSSLWIMNSDGSDPHSIYPPEGTAGISATRPDWSWSPDIAFAQDGVIYTIHPDGTGAAPYYRGDVPLPEGIVYPSWDRDGKSLVAVRYFQEDGAKQAELYRLTPTTFERLTESPHPVAGRPSVSPDGRKIAFAGNEGRYQQEENQIWVVEPPGKPYRLEPGDPILYQGRSPNWSPDGKQIVFESTRPLPGFPKPLVRPLGIWVIDSDGKNPRPLTGNLDFNLSHPEWSRQQTRIVLNGPGQGKGIGIIDLRTPR